MVRRDDEADYDVDSVVEWRVDKGDVTQQGLKDTVGDTLDSYVKARASSTGIVPTGCEESRRCWTLAFEEPFHMDVLPAIPDVGAPPTGILLPDRELIRWQFGDPIGFADWFFDQMATELSERKAEYAKSANVDVEEVPTWQVRTTLQQVVQVFKAHRNRYFADDDPHQPSSIVITTLAAQAYRGERQLLEAVMNAASAMPHLVERDGLRYVVRNPVQERENFADMWTSRSAARFFEWIGDVQQTLDQAVGIRTGVQAAVDVLGPRFGAGAVQRSASWFGRARNTARTDGRLEVGPTGLVGAAGLKVRDHTFDGE
jgi:hypothetical protein